MIKDLKELKTILEQKILESENIVIVPHNGIDFDAIASALGIALIAKKFKKQFCIIIDDPMYKIDFGVQTIINEVKNDFKIINKETYLKNINSNNLFILTDVNKSCLINISDQIKDEDKVIIIDHHNEDEKTIKSNFKYIKNNVSSASEIITKLLCLFKIDVNNKIANYLLAGIYLDTNKFTKNATAETMQTVTKLLKKGATINKVDDMFTEDFVSDRRVQELVSKTEMITYSVAMVLAEEGIEYTKEELAKVADYLLKYRVDASFAIGNIGDNIVSISARSKEKINVGEIMSQLEGGGNEYSGATKLTNCTIEEAGKRLSKIITPTYYKK